jgi:hypothetical protein
MQMTFHRIGWLVVILVALMFLANGAFMFISPQAWFKLPSWLAPKGGHMTRKRIEGVWGDLEVRVCGAIFLGVPIWVFYNVLFKST